jgi:hypothetical protein
VLCMHAHTVGVHHAVGMSLLLPVRQLRLLTVAAAVAAAAVLHHADPMLSTAGCFRMLTHGFANYPQR